MQNRFFRVALVVAGVPTLLLVVSSLRSAPERWFEFISNGFIFMAVVMAIVVCFIWALSPRH